MWKRIGGWKNRGYCEKVRDREAKEWVRDKKKERERKERMSVETKIVGEEERNEWAWKKNLERKNDNSVRKEDI